MFDDGGWVNPLTVCTLIQNYTLMNCDEFHEIQEMACWLTPRFDMAVHKCLYSIITVGKYIYDCSKGEM